MKPALILLGALLISGTVKAQTEETNTELGITYTLPEGWTATQKDKEILIGSEKIDGFIVIRSATYKTLKKMKAAMEAGIAHSSGTLLTPTTELQSYGPNGYAGLYRGSIAEEPILGFLVGRFNTNAKRGILIIGAAPDKKFNQSHMDAVKLIGRTLTFK